MNVTEVIQHTKHDKLKRGAVLWLYKELVRKLVDSNPVRTVLDRSWFLTNRLEMMSYSRATRAQTYLNYTHLSDTNALTTRHLSQTNSYAYSRDTNILSFTISSTCPIVYDFLSKLIRYTISEELNKAPSFEIRENCSLHDHFRMLTNYLWKLKVNLWENLHHTDQTRAHNSVKSKNIKITSFPIMFTCTCVLVKYSMEPG